jgi:hypothetical protein
MLQVSLISHLQMAEQWQLFCDLEVSKDTLRPPLTMHLPGLYVLRIPACGVNSCTMPSMISNTSFHYGCFSVWELQKPLIAK